MILHEITSVRLCGIFLSSVTTPTMQKISPALYRLREQLFVGIFSTVVHGSLHRDLMGNITTKKEH